VNAPVSGNVPGALAAGTFRVVSPLAGALASPEICGVLFDRSTSSDAAVRNATSEIIASVRTHGDDALRALAAKFSGVTLTSLEVPKERMQAALSELPAELRDAMQRAAANIRRVHSEGMPAPFEIETEPGVIVGRRPDPMDSVGVYAPGGRASYPSSVLMGAIPARCAGVREVILCSPPGVDGAPSREVLAAAAIAGVDRVFAIGGAGAIAAMALGTTTVPRVQKIVGPGNAYVAEAKLQLSGSVAFDSPAGPSELLVIVDDAASLELVALDMLAQAEHDPRAAVLAVCTSEAVALQLAAAIDMQIESQPRQEVIRDALRAQGALLWASSDDEILNFVARYAPEHLLIATRNANDLAVRVRNAGTIFIGENSSVSFGDYMTGANHVLPTGALACSYSGLSTLDFIRWTTWQRISAAGARAMARDVAIFAEAEQLPGHAAAALAREGVR
jgi:histidinol dehydrogenase